MADSADNILTYRQMLKVDRRSRVFTLLAEELCAAGEWEEAARVCKQGLLFHPDHLRSRVLLGWALMEMGKSEQAERILLAVVEDIRKNSISFRLLSEFATHSGDAERAGEYARIYEAFHLPCAAPEEIRPPEEAERGEVALTPEEKAEERDDLEAGATEEIEEPGLAAPEAEEEIVVQAAPEVNPEPKPGLDEILARLVQRIEERFDREKDVPAAILSEDDREFLREKTLAALTGA